MQYVPKHDSQKASYESTYKFLSSKYGPTHNESILGWIELINGHYHFIPMNLEITEDYPDIQLLVSHPEPQKLSQDHYYEAKFQCSTEKNEVLYVTIEKTEKFGVRGDSNDDKRAWLHVRDPCFAEYKKGDFKKGILKRRFDGKATVNTKDVTYMVLENQDKNRAFPNSEVKFKEFVDRGKPCAEVVSIEKCSIANKDLYGILQIGGTKNNDKYYYPLPKLDWTAEDPLKTMPMDSPPLTEEGTAALKSMLERREAFKKISKRKCYFVPFNSSLGEEFLCWDYREKLKDHPNLWKCYVRVRYTEWPINSEYPFVSLEEVLGEIGDPTADARVVLRSNGVTTDDFAPEIIEEFNKFKESWDPIMEKAKATELNNEIIFAIDGASTKCRDDAVSIKKIKNNNQEYYEVGVHIADPSRIIMKDTLVYKEAKSRFQSTYVGKYFFKPMIPFDFQQMLSLQENEYRYAFSMYIYLNEKGELCKKETRFQSSVIKPYANFIYEQIDEQLKDHTKKTLPCTDEVVDALFLLHKLTANLNEVRKSMGLNVDLNDDSEEDQNTPSHILVAELMVLTNELATDYVVQNLKNLENKLHQKRKKEKELAQAEKKKGISAPDANDSELSECSNKGSDSEKGSDDDDDLSDVEEQDSESDNDDVDADGMEESGAIKACDYVKIVWKSVDPTKDLDLTKSRKYAKSVDIMMAVSSIKSEIKSFLKYTLRLNSRKIKLYIKKKLFAKDKKDTEESKNNEDSDSENEEAKQVDSPDQKEELDFELPQLTLEKKASSIRIEPKKELVFDIKANKKLMKAYNNYKESEKMKFTSPVRKFHDMLVHSLIKDMILLENEIINMDETIKQGLLDDKTKQFTRYKVYNRLHKKLNGVLSGIKKTKRGMKKLFEEKMDRGMNKAEREIGVMEICKSIISENKKILADGLITKIQRREIKVFLPQYGMERSIDVFSRNQTNEKATIEVDNKEFNIEIYGLVEVYIKVKDAFPLDYELEFVKLKESKKETEEQNKPVSNEDLTHKSLSEKASEIVSSKSEK